VIIALCGSLVVVITDKNGNQERVHLNRGYESLYLPPKTWRHLENFSTNSVSLHLSSSSFNTDDYILNFDEYRELK
jgi:hypothetical protein